MGTNTFYKSARNARGGIQVPPWPLPRAATISFKLRKFRNPCFERYTQNRKYCAALLKIKNTKQMRTSNVHGTATPRGANETARKTQTHPLWKLAPPPQPQLTDADCSAPSPGRCD